MRQIGLSLAALGIATLLVACGDGGMVNPPPANPTITGWQPPAAALANASVTAKCSSGVPVSGTTSADGTFSLELGGGQNVPCLLQVKRDLDPARLCWTRVTSTSRL
jgi:hypothetical protein